MEVFYIPNNNTATISPGRYLTYGEMYVMDQFQRHLLDLAIWSRALVIGLKYNLPNTEVIFNKLLEVPTDTHEILAIFFGLENANTYENYLLQFITNLRHLTDALLTNNAQQADESYKNLHQITDDISMFFYKLNPSSSLDQWHSLLHEYVDLLYNDIYAIVSDNYTGDIALFEKIIDQSYLIADYISDTVLSVLHPAATNPPAGATPSG